MSDGKKYYCFCSSNCKYETMTKEQILAAIEQAVEDGEIRDVDTGFVTRVQELHAAKALTFWIGTMAAYNAIETPETNCLYIITDDTQEDDLNNTMGSLMRDVVELQEQYGTLAGKMEEIKNAAQFPNEGQVEIKYSGFGYLHPAADGANLTMTIPVSKTFNCEWFMFTGNIRMYPCIPYSELLSTDAPIEYIKENDISVNFEYRPTGIYMEVFIPQRLLTGSAQTGIWYVDIDAAFPVR